MNQEKIGKLIAKMRKSKGLTQRELGDMVGVGYRAVSKWETGLTMPDISIINDLSEILGITSDELLKGELNTKSNSNDISTTKSNNLKYLLLIVPVLLVVVIAVLVLSNLPKKGVTVDDNGVNDTDTGNVYDLVVVSSDASIDGKLLFDGEYVEININYLSFDHYDFNTTMISSCQYDLFYNDMLMYSYNLSGNTNKMNFPLSIKEFTQKFKLDYRYRNSSFDVSNADFLNLKFHFVDVKNDVIDRNIEVKIVPE